MTFALAGWSAGQSFSVPGLDQKVSAPQRRVIMDMFSVAADTLAGRPIQSSPQIPCLKKTEQIGFFSSQKAGYDRTKQSLGKQGFNLTKEKSYDTMLAFEMKRAKHETWIGGWIRSTSGGNSTFFMCRSK